jgi:phosphonoacetaldehyde hydrolase
MIFRNMENLGIYSVDEVIKVGDTVADIQEGLNAGVWTIGITTTGNEVGLNLEDWLSLTSQEKENLRTKAADKLSEAGAHFIIHDMRELPELIDEINLILESEQDLA